MAPQLRDRATAAAALTAAALAVGSVSWDPGIALLLCAAGGTAAALLTEERR